jgi:hypothetical protein
LLQDTHLSDLAKLNVRLASNRYPFWLTWALKLAMTTCLCHLKPTIIIDRFEGFANIHAIASCKASNNGTRVAKRHRFE